MCHLPQLRYRRSGRTSLCSRRAFRSAKVLKLQKQTCQKLWPLRSLKFEARLLLPTSIFQNKNLSSRSVCGGQRDNLPTEASSSRLRSDSFQKLRMLRNRLSLKSSLRSASTGFQKTDV